MSETVQVRAAVRLKVLDGWRAVSIGLVLLGHLLPLGPKPWRINELAALAGMVFFFILSGFLIGSFLLSRHSVGDFFIRRLCRILPLAWSFMALAGWYYSIDLRTLAGLFLFYANLPPERLTEWTAHLWSLCMEVQFYGAMGLVVALAGRRAIAPFAILACLLITGLRIATDTYSSGITWLRCDEIFAGVLLALQHRALAARPELLARLQDRMAGATGPAVVSGAFLLVLASSYPRLGAICFLRPYLAMLCIGTSLLLSECWIRRLLESRPMAYLAEISYAVYIWHVGLEGTWFGSGDKRMKYLKRPALVLMTWALSHLSTRYFEKYFIGLGKRLTRG